MEEFWPNIIFPFTMKFFKPKLQNIFFYQENVHLGETTLIYCSQKTVVHVHVNVVVFLNSFKHAKVMQTELNQEGTKK